ncbi:hypothetical protein NQ315_006415 [Exocentrus adspersus]|uniref:Caspase-3 n=1 Tax=Exocentrus adspersus TaxID=1586481 RepID=A0AAV8W1R9_9CUCU|nr:hypothetical protein NQ315_006415 [Exocentrus adspersus]
MNGLSKMQYPACVLKFLSHHLIKMTDAANIGSSGSQEHPVAPSPKSHDYKKYKKRGIAVIFNHKQYEINLETRFGTDKDRDELSAEIEAVLSRITGIDHSEHECLLVAAMSHGEEKKFYARDRAFPVNGLWMPFLHVPSLVGKPKLFFIQACRGNKVDPGVIVSFAYDECDTQNQKKTYSMPITADMLLMFSTFEGYYSYRDPKKGSYFIQALAYQLKAAEDRNLLSILTNVNREVAVNYEDKEMCTILSTLTRRFSLE